MGNVLFLSEFKEDGLKNDFYCLFLAYQKKNESHKSDPNSDITDPSNIESDTELRDSELESDPELESYLDANHMGADSSFDANTSTKIDQEEYVEEFPWLYYNVLEKGFKCKSFKLFPAIGSRNATHKFGKDAVKSLTDHPRHLLHQHAESKKHQNASKEYEVCEITFKIVTKMKKHQPSLIIFTVFTFLECILIMRIPAPTMT